MNKELMKCLVEERSIFRNFSSNKIIGNYEAFKSPDSDQVPHWNLCYPLSDQTTIPSVGELNDLKEFYESVKINGHILCTDDKYSSKSKEESEYFILDKSIDNTSPQEVDNLTHDPENLSQFTKVIQQCFDFNDQTTSYFESKMNVLAKRPNSHFYVVRARGSVIGCCSTFRTDGNCDFLFNVATLPSARNSGAAKSVIHYSARQSVLPIYTYSHHVAMRKSVLPHAGFRSIGRVYCVPLAEFS